MVTFMADEKAVDRFQSHFARDQLQRQDVVAARIINASFDKECIKLAVSNGLDEYAKPLFGGEENG
jgi:hypothetical protein